MGKLIVITNLTLDGVMQAPGRPDEDTRGDFRYGGWATPFAAMQSATVGENLTNFGALLLGRRTYEDFYAYWPNQINNPFTDVLNKMPKYVVSTSLQEPLAWENSTLINSKVPNAIAALKAQAGADIVIMGSGELNQTLMQHNLVDLYILMIHPLVLGVGRRLFNPESPFATLQLVTAKPTPNGVIVATYRPTAASAST
jgi:dihydrofolate reductase